MDGAQAGPSRARGGGGHPFAVLTRSSPPLCAGSPRELVGAQDPHPHLTGRGAGARRGAAGLSWAEEGEDWVPG